MKDLTVSQAKRFGAIYCGDHTRLLEAAQRMVSEDISALVVQDPQGYLVGVITRTDLLQAYVECEDWQLQPVRAFMSREVITVQPHDRLDQVARLMVENGVHRVVIVQKEQDTLREQGGLRPIGVISDGDLLYHMVNEPLRYR